MKVFNNISNYLIDKSFKINVIDNKVNIDNYTDIISIESNRISLYNKDKIVVIKGNNLLIKKLLDNELLITGNIKSIDLE